MGPIRGVLPTRRFLPELKSVYADLFWDLSKLLTGNSAPVEFAHLAIDAALDALEAALAQLGLHLHPTKTRVIRRAPRADIRQSPWGRGRDVAARDRCRWCCSNEGGPCAQAQGAARCSGSGGGRARVAIPAALPVIFSLGENFVPKSSASAFELQATPSAALGRPVPNTNVVVALVHRGASPGANNKKPGCRPGFPRNALARLREIILGTARWTRNARWNRRYRAGTRSTTS